MAAGLLVTSVAVVVGWQWMTGEPEQATPAPTGRSEEVTPEPEPEDATPQPRDEPEAAAPEPAEDREEAGPEPAGVVEDAAPPPAGRNQLPFDEPTGTALIFDAGARGAVVLDVDTGSTARFRLPRGDAADQPFPLLRRGEWLVVAQHGGWALTPGEGHTMTARSLGDGGFAVPGADPEQVWLIDHGDSQDEATWTLVEVTGEVLARTRIGQGYTPLRGTLGELAVRDERGAVHLYHVEASGIRPFLAEGTRVIAAAADRLVTCSEPCAQLMVRDESWETIQHLGTEGVRGHGSGWLSPDGRLLAVVASVNVHGPAGGAAGSVEVRIYDVDAGDLAGRAAVTLGDFAGSWTPDGKQFFYRTVTDGPPTPLGRYTVGEGFEIAPLDPHDAPLGDFVAFARESLAPLLADNP